MSILKISNHQLHFNDDTPLLQDTVDRLIVTSKMLDFRVDIISITRMKQVYIDIKNNVMGFYIIFDLKDDLRHVQSIEIWEPEGVTYRGLVISDVVFVLNRLIDKSIGWSELLNDNDDA